MRLVGPSEAIREAYPEAYIELAALVTELGGTTVPMILLAMLFWLTRRRETAMVVSYAAAGIGVVLLLKAGFDLPRPPAEAAFVPVEADPYGFPSGHAFASVVVYGGLLVAFDRWRDPLAIAAACAVVVLVSLSRVVLGVHYLGDVIAGVVVGIGFLTVAARFVRTPRTGFALALALSMAAAIATGGIEDSLLGVGVAVGGLLGTRRLSAVPPLRSPAEGAVLAVAGLAVLIGGSAIESRVAAEPAAAVAANAALVAGIFLLPRLVARLETDLVAPPSGATSE